MSTPLLPAIAMAAASLPAVILFRDLRLLRKKVEALSEKKISHRSIAPDPAVFTSTAKIISEHIEVLINRLLDGKEDEKLRRSRIDPGYLFPELTQSASKDIDDALVIHRRVAAFLEREIIAEAAAVFFKPVSVSGNTLSIAGGSRFLSRNLECHLRGYFEQVMLTAAPQSGELRSCCEVPDERVFYHVVVPFEDPPFEKSFVWAGFKEYETGLKGSEILRNLATGLSAELRQVRRLYEGAFAFLEQGPGRVSKHELLAHVSHDIKSPLNNIRSILNLLNVEAHSAENSELFEVALNNCEAVGELVDSVLDLSACESGKLRAHPEVFDPAPLLEEIARAYSVSARLKGLSITVETEAPGHIYADKKHVRRILANLAGNAVKYTRHGSVTIRAGSSQGDAVCVSVGDTGMGIDENRMKDLFQPFTRLHPEMNEGAGLGLAVSRILAELNGGGITVQSRRGEGSCFKVFFPAAECLPPGGAGPVLLRSRNAATEVKKVLLVDDDVDFLESTARNFSHDPVIIIKASSINEALELVNFEKPGFVISDDAMPGGGGVALCKALRGKGIQSPFAIISGNGSEVRGRYEKAGIDVENILEKPVDIDELRDWILSGDIPASPAKITAP